MTDSGSWRRWLRLLDEKLESYLLIVLYVYIFSIVVLTVFFRFALGFSFVWGNETAIFTYIYLTWIGASLATKRRMHIRIDLLHNYIPERAIGVIYILSDIAMLVFVGLVMTGFVPVMQNSLAFGTITDALRVSTIYFLIALPLGLGLLTIRSLQMLYRDSRDVLRGDPVFKGENLLGE